MKYVGVKFRDTKFDTDRLGPKVYVYKTNLELEPNDNVVVETYKGPATAVVTDITPERIANLLREAEMLDRQVKYVICRFDMTAVEEMKAYEAKLEFTKQKIKDSYRKKMLNQMADEFITEFPELKEDIESMRELGELERLFGDTM